MEPIDWEAIYREYFDREAEARSTRKVARPFEASPSAVGRLTQPTSDDARWLIEALRHQGEQYDGRRWFLIGLLQQSPSVADVFFVPFLDAAIDEPDPSYNRHFVQPCIRSAGPRRVLEYLLSVLEHGTDRRKTGAVRALYWADVPLDSLADTWKRRDCLLLETFVANPNIPLRRSIIASLNLDANAYPESHRPFVAQAIGLARAHEDGYIRQRVELRLGV